MKTSNLEIYVREVKPSKKFPYTRYQAYFYIYQNGKRVRIRSDYFTTPTKAKKHVKELQLEYMKNGSITNKEMTIDDVFKLWIESANIKYKTKQTYKSVYNIYFKGIRKEKKHKDVTPINNTKLIDLSPMILQHFINYAYKNLINNRATWSHFRSVLKHTLTYAYKKDLLANNLNDKLDFPTAQKQPIREVKPANFEDCKKYVQYIYDGLDGSVVRRYSVEAHILLLELLRITGARINELLAMTWDDLDVQNRTLKINKALIHVTGVGLRLDSTKTIATNRNIPISEQTCKVLITWKTRQKELLQARGIENENNTIITSIKGKYLSDSTVNGRMDAFEKKTGIKIHPHQFRHAKATLLLNVMHESVANVSKVLGHASKSSTYNYIHEDNELVKEMNEKYEKLTPSLLN